MEGLLLDYLRDHTDRSVRHAARTCFQAFNDFWIKEEEHAMILDEQRRPKERELEELLEKADVARESEGRMKKQVRMVTVTAAVCISVVRLRLRLRLFVYLSAMARSP